MRRNDNSLRRSRRGRGMPLTALAAITAIVVTAGLAGRVEANPDGVSSESGGASDSEHPRFSTTRWERSPNAVRAVLNERTADILAEGETAGVASETGPAGRESFGRRARRTAGAAGRMLADPRFAGAIVVSDLARAGLEGNPDAAGDTFAALETPEFWAGIGMFNASMMAGEAVTAPAFKRLTGRIGANSLGARAAGALKHNLVLAGALTVPRLFEVDFNGFTFGDAVNGEFGELSEASISWSGEVSAQDVGITLGAFAIAQPVWKAIKKGGAYIGKRLLARLARTAAVKGALAVAPVPGSRVVALALTIGEVLWTVVDLAGLLFTAGKIEEQVVEWNDHRRSVNAVQEATDALVDAFEDGEPDRDRLDELMAEVGVAFGNHRDFLYLPTAIEDVEHVDRILRMGETQENMQRISSSVMDDFGAWLAMPGQTSILLEEYAARIRHARQTGDTSDIPGGDLGAFEELVERHAERVREHLAELDDAERVDPMDFSPLVESFEPSRNREELYEQELHLYRQLLDRATDPDVRDRLLGEIATLEAVAEVDARLFDHARLGAATPATADVAVGVDGETIEDDFAPAVAADIVVTTKDAEPTRTAPGFADALGGSFGDATTTDVDHAGARSAFDLPEPFVAARDETFVAPPVGLGFSEDVEPVTLFERTARAGGR